MNFLKRWIIKIIQEQFAIKDQEKEARYYIVTKSELSDVRAALRYYGETLQDIKQLDTYVKNIVAAYGGEAIDERVGRLEWMIKYGKTYEEANKYFLIHGQWSKP